MSSLRSLPDLSTCLASQIGADLDSLAEPARMSLKRMLAVLSHSDPSNLEANLAGWLDDEIPHETVRRYALLRQLISLVGELGWEDQL